MSGVASVAVEWFHTTRDAGVVVGARDLVKMYGSGEARVVSLGVGRGRFRGGRITTDNPTHHHGAPAAAPPTRTGAPVRRPIHPAPGTTRYPAAPGRPATASHLSASPTDGATPRPASPLQTRRMH